MSDDGADGAVSRGMPCDITGLAFFRLAGSRCRSVIDQRCGAAEWSRRERKADKARREWMPPDEKSVTFT